MKIILSVVALCFAIVAVTHSAAVEKDVRIVGGSVTTIDQYPQIVALLYALVGTTFVQNCGGTIINTRSILTAAHCTVNNTPDRWRARVGSTYASSGGTVHSITSIINHPAFSILRGFDSDISIVRTASAITYVNNAVQPGSFAGTNYNTGDNAVVWAAGWGFTEFGSVSEQLRHVQIWTVNHDVCRQRYGAALTDNMLCSGWLDVGGRDQCNQDSGGPLYHNGVVVGVSSFGNGCGSPVFPGVNTRVSRFIDWIQTNA